jgi:hypothetical protein
VILSDFTQVRYDMESRDVLVAMITSLLKSPKYLWMFLNSLALTGNILAFMDMFISNIQ